MSLASKSAVVTGSTSGIGLAIARALAAEGANVMLNGFGKPEDIEKERAAIESEFGVKAIHSPADMTKPAEIAAMIALAEAYGVRVLYHPADMTKPAEIADMIATANREFGRLDILVNNAGVQFVSPIEDFPIEKWDQIIAINLTSAFHTTRAAVPIMKAAGHGRIVNIASAHALVASPFKGAYVAAKHGILGLTKTVALEVAQDGVTCNAICPGYVKTPLVESQIADQAKARGMTPEQVMRDVILAAQPTKKFVEFDQLAGLMLYLASDMGASANGASLSIDGGWTAA